MEKYFPIDPSKLCRAALVLHLFLLLMVPMSPQVYLLTSQLPREVSLQSPRRDGCVFKDISGVELSD